MSWRRTLRHRSRPSWYLLGPAFVAAIAYVDPGNVAANVSSGAQFGYLLLWVIVVANVMAGLVQYLSAKLGLVTGRSLPEAIGSRMGRPARLAYLGAGRNRGDGNRCGRSDRRGHRAADPVQPAAAARRDHHRGDLVAAAGGPGPSRPAPVRARHHRPAAGDRRRVSRPASSSRRLRPTTCFAGLVPRFQGTESVLLAAAILGATVMPHAVYLHSGLALRPARASRSRATSAPVAARHPLGRRARDGRGRRRSTPRCCWWPRSTCGVTRSPRRSRAPTPPSTTPWARRSRCCSRSDCSRPGLASSSVGAYAGAMIMQGLLHWSVPMLVRRLITLCPAW